MKCSRVGCNEEATHRNPINIAVGVVAEELFCDKHFNEEYERKEGKTR